MHADALPAVTSNARSGTSALALRLTLLAVACTAIALLAPASSHAASPLSAGPLNVSAGMAQDGRIAAGLDHSCAIRTDGTPICWGDNTFGQAAIPADIGTVTRITAGNYHTCAIKTDGTPICWGDNFLGQIAIPAGIGTVIQITTWSSHTCAIKTDGTPTCWGLNSDGQATVPAGTGTVTDITTGSDHTCAIKTDGTPVCWGRNSLGQTTIPAGIGTVTQIAAGFSHTCAIRTDGTPTCWGNNASGQATVPSGTTATQIITSAFHTCAIRTDSTPVCWGSNNGTVPPGTGTVAQISAGSGHTCAIKTDGTPTCWGNNDSGQATVPPGTGTVSVPQLDTGSVADHTCAIRPDGTPVCWGSNGFGQATVPAGIGTVTQITVGDRHTCAIKTDGTPTCWGENGGFGKTTIPAGTGTVTQITAGSRHTCAIKTDGTPTCWGDNDFGQSTIPAGTGTVTDISPGSLHTCAIKTGGTPICWGFGPDGEATIPAGIGTVTQIASGSFHTCAIKTDGTPVCWGNNAFGMATVPAGTGTVTQITAGFNHTCAITSDGTPICWGSNNNNRSTVPAGTGTVTQITAGRAHTCVITSDGIPACWGSNASGQSRATISVTAPAWIGAGSFSLQVTGTPLRSVAVTGGALPGGLSVSPAGLISGTPTAEGQFTATITNSSDNLPPSASTDVTLNVDITKPSTTDNVPTGFVSAPVTVTLTASDTGGSGVKTTTYEVVSATGTPGATQTYSAAAKPVLNDGERIRYRSVDEAGNVETDKTSSAAKVDTAAPSTSDDVPASWVNAPVTVTLTASAGSSAVKTTTYEILDSSGTAGATMTYDPASKPVLGDGERIRYRSQSNAGVTEADKTSSAAKVDQAAPVTSDDVPAAFQSGPVTVTLAASDTGGSGLKDTTFEIVDAAGNPGPTKVYDPAAKPALGDGERIRYRSSDEAGNVEAAKTSAAAKVDAKVPTATITTAPALSSAERSPTVAFTSDGVDATYQCSLDNAPFTTCTSPLTLGPLADGQHTFRVRATSRAGVTGPIATAAFTIAQPVITPAAQTPAASVPAPTLRLLGGGKERQILLNKRWISVRVTCGPVPCTLRIATVLRAKNTTRVRLKTRTITLAANQTRTLRIATTKTQRRIIRRLVGRRGTGGQARFTLTATTTNGTTATTIVRIGLRRLANQ